MNDVSFVALFLDSFHTMNGSGPRPIHKEITTILDSRFAMVSTFSQLPIWPGTAVSGPHVSRIQWSALLTLILTSASV